MLKLTDDLTGRSIELSDGDFETIINALTSIAAECSHTAANAQFSWDRDAFNESAESYRNLRTRLEAL